MIRKKTTKRRSKSKAIPVSYKGIKFKSKLERSMYIMLCSNNIEANYEKEQFVLQEGFSLDNLCVERQMNGKGDFIDRSHKKVTSISYTPDFTGVDFIIETKGWAGDRFPLVWRLFKHHLKTIGDTRMVFKPQSLTDCSEVVRLIKEQRLNGKANYKKTK